MTQPTCRLSELLPRPQPDWSSLEVTGALLLVVFSDLPVTANEPHHLMVSLSSAGQGGPGRADRRQGCALRAPISQPPATRPEPRALAPMTSEELHDA